MTDIDQKLAELSIRRLVAQDALDFDTEEMVLAEIDYWLDLKLEQRGVGRAVQFLSPRHAEGNPGS